MRVYGWDQDPAVDRFSFRLSDARAHELGETGGAVVVIDGDGREALQLVPPKEIAYPLDTAAGGNVIPFSRIETSTITRCCARPRPPERASLGGGECQNAHPNRSQTISSKASSGPGAKVHAGPDLVGDFIVPPPIARAVKAGSKPTDL